MINSTVNIVMKAGQKPTGWLLFFIASCMIITPIFSLFVLAVTWAYQDIFTIIESLAGISIYMLCGYFLYTKKPHAVIFAKVWLIFTLAIDFVSYILSSIPEYIGFGPNFLFPIIWFWYLSKSEQVRELYGRIKQPKQGNSVWAILGLVYSFVAPLFGLLFAIMAFIDLGKNKKKTGKAMAVVAVIISIAYLIFLIGIYGVMASVPEYAIPADVDVACHDYCFDVDGATRYYSEYDPSYSEYFCYCTNEESELVRKIANSEIQI